MASSGLRNCCTLFCNNTVDDIKLTRAIKEAIFIRVNDPSLKRQICKSMLNLALYKSSSRCLVDNYGQMTIMLGGGYVKGAHIIYWT